VSGFQATETQFKFQPIDLLKKCGVCGEIVLSLRLTDSWQTQQIGQVVQHASVVERGFKV